MFWAFEISLKETRVCLICLLFVFQCSSCLKVTLWLCDKHRCFLQVSLAIASFALNSLLILAHSQPFVNPFFKKTFKNFKNFNFFEISLIFQLLFAWINSFLLNIAQYRFHNIFRKFFSPRQISSRLRIASHRFARLPLKDLQILSKKFTLVNIIPLHFFSFFFLL